MPCLSAQQAVECQDHGQRQVACFTDPLALFVDAAEPTQHIPEHAGAGAGLADVKVEPPAEPSTGTTQGEDMQHPPLKKRKKDKKRKLDAATAGADHAMIYR